MKKLILLSSLGFSIAFAAPTITGSGVTIAPGNTGTYTLDYAGQADNVAAADIKIDFSALPNNVTLTNLTSSNNAVFGCAENNQVITCSIATDQFDPLFNPLPVPDTTGFLTFDISVPAGAAAASYTISATQLDFKDTTGADVAGGVANLGDVIISGAPAFNTTVNYSTDPASTGTGTFACDSGATGATVAGGTTVTCTATPNGTDTSSIAGCPAGATTNTDTSCVFDASTTANETVNLVATFNTGGTGTTYNLTVSPATNGTLACTPNGAVTAGTSVTCTATPDAGYNVGTWTAPVACNGASCNFNMPAADTTVSVTFTAVTNTDFTVVPSAIGTGTGTVSCTPMNGTITVAAVPVNCTATPDAGMTFGGWNAPAACIGAASNACTFNAVPGNNFVVAIFNNPNIVTPITTPVPSTGLLGLFVMVLSLLSAAFVAIRRKR